MLSLTCMFAVSTQRTSCEIFERNVAFPISETNLNRENIMQKFDTPAAVSAVLYIPAGRIQVIAADRADTTVEVRPADASKGRDVKAAEQTEVEFGDGVLRITAPAGKILGPTGSIEVTVQVPTGFHVEAKAAAAEFRAVGRLGTVAFDGAHSTVKIDEAAGIRLTAHDADITVGRLTGSADISTQKGD